MSEIGENTAHGRVTIGSIQEALAASQAEDDGIFGRLYRGDDSTYCFIDELGNKIDVKFFNSKFRLYEFSMEKYMYSVKDGINSGFIILIDTAGSSSDDLNYLNYHLIKSLSAADLIKIKFVDSDGFNDKSEHEGA